ncbi:uncharacterized protein LOC134247597 [Saccostrea cucullata]|uniref:uncharacterized protein LOC134247597 n=1 Tax=Saccostrea cuccullata TaxID=36930 RepID=UPI002ED64304
MAFGPNPGGRSRFAKLGMAINEELTKACRDVLEIQVPPGLVYSKVKASSIYKKIRPEQELRLIGAKIDGYKEFDITLLYTLIRNTCTKIPRPTKGWGGNTMPSVGETTIGDDIERIRLIRNNMFGHISSASATDLEFHGTWLIITEICQRLQSYTKKDYLSGLSDIQSQALEEENIKYVLKRLKEQYENNQCLMEMVSSAEEHVLEKMSSLGACVLEKVSSSEELVVKKVSSAEKHVMEKVSSLGERVVEKVSSSEELVVKKVSSAEKHVVEKVSSLGERVVEKISSMEQHVLELKSKSDEKSEHFLYYIFMKITN